MERDGPADICGSGDQDLAFVKFADARYVVDHADFAGDDACSTCKAFDVGGAVCAGGASGHVIIVSSVRIFHPLTGIEPANDDAGEARIGEISCKSLFAGRDV